MASVFTKIINGDIPCHKVAETDSCLAFLDINPLVKGHTLVIPKKEVDYIFDLDDDLYHELFAFARKVSSGLRKSVPCKRIGVAVIGLEVPHAHIHLVPLNDMGDLNFSNPKLSPSAEELSEIAGEIASNI